jgi:hypothetical protein
MSNKIILNLKIKNMRIVIYFSNVGFHLTDNLCPIALICTNAIKNICYYSCDHEFL